MAEKNYSKRCFVHSLVCRPQPCKVPSDSLQTGGAISPPSNGIPYKAPKLVQFIAELNPIISVPNALRTIIKDEDFYGNTNFTTFDKLVAGAGVFTTFIPVKKAGELVGFIVNDNTDAIINLATPIPFAAYSTWLAGNKEK